MIERVYQKEENLVRKEWKVSGGMSVNQFEAAIREGVAGHDKAQASFELTQEARKMVEALKFTNSRLFSVEKLQEAMYRKLAGNVEVDQSERSKTCDGGKGYTF